MICIDCHTEAEPDKARSLRCRPCANERRRLRRLARKAQEAEERQQKRRQAAANALY